MAETKPKAKKKAPKYKVIIEVNDKEFDLKGDVLVGVLKSLPKQDYFRTNMTITTKSGGKTVIEYISALKARAIFANKNAVLLLADKINDRLI